MHVHMHRCVCVSMLMHVMVWAACWLRERACAPTKAQHTSHFKDTRQTKCI